jgi:hypothetical protein
MRQSKHTEPPSSDDIRLARLLAEHAGCFDAYFPTRVLARVRALPPEAAWFFGLDQIFRRVAIVGAIAVGVLLAYNVTVNYQSPRGGNAIEIALAIPPATVATSIQYLDFSQ